MDTMIKEINDNLKAIIENIKVNRDNSLSALENIQMQMDKNIEEAKKYKVQVDSSKEKIKELEEANKSLEDSLTELNDKYSKMNLVSVIEAGNKEIKNKINENIKSINKEKELIVELTNKARSIKNLLIDLKKDKTAKEEKLESTKIIYDYFNDKISEITDYAFNHANNLSDYKNTETTYTYENDYDNEEESVKNIDLDNTMVFDEIVNIDNDDNNNYEYNNSLEENNIIKEDSSEGLFDNVEETDSVDNDVIENNDDFSMAFDEEKFNDIIKKSEEDSSEELNEDVKTEEINDEVDNFNNLFDKEDNEDVIDSNLTNDIEDNIDENKDEVLTDINPENINESIETNDVTGANNIFETETLNTIPNNDIETLEGNNDTNEVVDDNFSNINTDLLSNSNQEVIDEDKENEERINKINDLFSSLDSTNTPSEEVKPFINTGLENQIDNAYKDAFGVDINDADLNNKDTTLIDIFGNPIKKEELSDEVKKGKLIDDIFTEYGLDFNRFKEDEKSYLKQIYDENKFTEILNILKNNNISLENIYKAFNIFGEINPEELETIINKLINAGQSVEAIGIVLEKIPKLKKYNLDESIASFGDYVKDVDITELIMKAKELYDNGGNK